MRAASCDHVVLVFLNKRVLEELALLKKGHTHENTETRTNRVTTSLLKLLLPAKNVCGGIETFIMFPPAILFEKFCI